jgi:hypothetical protein
MFKHTSSFSPPYVGEGPQASSSPLSVISRIPVDVALSVVVPSICFLDIGHKWWTWGCMFSEPHTRYESYLRRFMLKQGVWMSRFVRRCTPISTYLLDIGDMWWTQESLFYRPSHQLLRLLYVDSVHKCFESIYTDVEVCDDMSPMGSERLTLCSSFLIYIWASPTSIRFLTSAPTISCTSKKLVLPALQ